jgi:MYXO-CTERM domain-containing protein
MTVSKYFSSLTILGVLTLSAPAWADVPPDDACFADALGKPCTNATDDRESFQPGVCKQAMCTRATPDGPLTYACYRCEPVDQGTGGQPNEGGAGKPDGGGSSAGGTAAGGTQTATAGATTAGTKSDSSADSDDGGSCSVSHARGGAGALMAALALLGVAVAGLYRRKSLPS